MEIPLKSPILRKLVQSPSIDVVGAMLVLGICIFRDFLSTIYLDGAVQFGVPLRDLPELVQQGAYPLGILSTVGAVFSMLSTRLIGKQKNVGNAIGVATTVNSGANDFLFGNGSAAITYPITFFIMTFAVSKWHRGEYIKSHDRRYFFIVLSGLALGGVLVFLGANLFGGRTDAGFLILVSITFGLSLGANLASAFKYKETWLSWTIYNLVQLAKNGMIANLANVIKYAFYLGNSLITLGDWKLNGDVHQMRHS